MDTAFNNAAPDVSTAKATDTPTAAAVPAVSTPAGACSVASADESLELLRKIDTNVTAMAERIESVEKAAVRSGAAAGAIAGALSGGIVATGIAIAKAHLGF